MKKIWELFFTFIRIGACTFGGGYSIMPILQKEIVEKKNWATEEDLMSYYAISQCTPGVIGVNTATFVGSRVLGNIGGFIATLGFVLPSYFIIIAIASFLTHFAEIPITQNAFAGIQVVVCALVLRTIWKMLRTGVSDLPTGAIFVSTFIGITFFQLSPILLVVIAALLGIAIRKIKELEFK